MIDHSKSPIELEASYREAYNLKPNDAMAAFCWAAAAWPAANFAKSDTEFASCDAGVAAALAAPSSPHCYEYDRMRYLFEIDHNWQQPELKALGKRLLRTNDNDPEVLQKASMSETDVQASIALIDRERKISPDQPGIDVAAAATYTDAYLDADGPKKYGMLAIAAFNRYLASRPNNVDSINWCKRYIAQITAKLRSN